MNQTEDDTADQSRCAKKLAFASRAEAEGARATAQSRYAGVRLRVYRCRRCKLYHLGTVYE